MSDLLTKWETLVWQNHERLLPARKELIENHGMDLEETFDFLLAAGAELIEFENYSPEQVLSELIDGYQQS